MVEAEKVSDRIRGICYSSNFQDIVSIGVWLSDNTIISSTGDNLEGAVSDLLSRNFKGRGGEDVEIKKFRSRLRDAGGTGNVVLRVGSRTVNIRFRHLDANKALIMAAIMAAEKVLTFVPQKKAGSILSA